MPTAWPRSSAPAGSREVRVKSAASHQIRALLSTRARLVAQRRELGLKLGGLLKTFGRPLGQVGPGRFEARVRELAAGIDDGLREAAEALLAVRERLAEPIARLDRLLRERARGDATCHRLMTVPGVGPLTALAFMTAVDDPERFAHSSSAGAYLGLTPRRSQAGAVDRPGRIAKCGAGLTRAYPVEAAPTLLTRVKRGRRWHKGCTPPEAVSWTNLDNNSAFLAQTLSIPAALKRERPDDYHQNAVTIEWPDGANGRPLVFIRLLPADRAAGAAVTGAGACTGQRAVLRNQGAGAEFVGRGPVRRRCRFLGHTAPWAAGRGMAIGRMALQRSTGDRPDDDESRPTDPALRRGFDLTTPARAGLAALGVVLLLYVAEPIAGVLLLLFAGILLAVLLRAASDGLNRLTGLPVTWCLALVVLALIAGVAVGGWLAAPFLVEQTVSFAEGVVNAVEELEGRLREADWAEAIAERINLDALLPDPGGLLGGATGLLTATFGTLATLAIILFFGVYLAANPGTYVEGFILLLPPARRLRARYVLSHVGHTLRWWLIGQAVSMVVIGAVSFVGLWLLGVPFAAPLAVLAGLLTFVPYLGAILSSIPIALVG
jgi:predicted PurR-regulated permease PerM